VEGKKGETKVPCLLYQGRTKRGTKRENKELYVRKKLENGGGRTAQPVIEGKTQKALHPRTNATSQKKKKKTISTKVSVERKGYQNRIPAHGNPN